MPLWDDLNIDFLGLLQPQKPWRSKIIMPMLHYKKLNKFMELFFFSIVCVRVWGKCLGYLWYITSIKAFNIFLMNNEKGTVLIQKRIEPLVYIVWDAGETRRDLDNCSSISLTLARWDHCYNIVKIGLAWAWKCWTGMNKNEQAWTVRNRHEQEWKSI